MDKIIETVMKDTRFFVNKELGHHFPVKQFVPFLE